MFVLSIGNSFSQDSQRYLHQIAQASGEKIACFNLYAAACDLEQHYRNMLSDDRGYTLEMNGSSTGFSVSLSEALLNRQWDVVSLQQVSSKSADYENYQPYLTELADFVRQCQPKCKLLLHQPWAYESGSETLKKRMGLERREDMFRLIHGAYAQAVRDAQADGIVPCGALFEELAKAGLPQLQRDTLHAGLGAARYALGLLWYKVLTGKMPPKGLQVLTDRPISPEEMETVYRCVEKIG